MLPQNQPTSKGSTEVSILLQMMDDIERIEAVTGIVHEIVSTVCKSDEKPKSDERKQVVESLRSENAECVSEMLKYYDEIHQENLLLLKKLSETLRQCKQKLSTKEENLDVAVKSLERGLFI